MIRSRRVEPGTLWDKALRRALGEWQAAAVQEPWVITSFSNPAPAAGEA